MRLMLMAPNERVVTVGKRGSAVTIAYASTYDLLAFVLASLVGPASGRPAA